MQRPTQHSHRHRTLPHPIPTRPTPILHQRNPLILIPAGTRPTCVYLRVEHVRVVHLCRVQKRHRLALFSRVLVRID